MVRSAGLVEPASADSWANPPPAALATLGATNGAAAAAASTCRRVNLFALMPTPTLVRDQRYGQAPQRLCKQAHAECVSVDTLTH
jgi:hypothetical protein